MILLMLFLQILYDSQARSRSVSESASSDTTAPAGDSTSDTPSATVDNEAANQEQEEVEGMAAWNMLKLIG